MNSSDIFALDNHADVNLFVVLVSTDTQGGMAVDFFGVGLSRLVKTDSAFSLCESNSSLSPSLVEMLPHTKRECTERSHYNED